MEAANPNWKFEKYKKIYIPKTPAGIWKLVVSVI